MSRKVADLTVEELRDEFKRLPSAYLENVIVEVLENKMPKMPFWINAEKHYQDHSFVATVRAIWGYVWKAAAGVSGVLGFKWIFFK